MVKKAISDLDFRKVTAPYCILRLVLRKSEPERSLMLADPFNNCFKQSLFPDCWKVSDVVHIFKNVRERYILLLVFFLLLVKFRVLLHTSGNRLFS